MGLSSELGEVARAGPTLGGLLYSTVPITAQGYEYVYFDSPPGGDLIEGGAHKAQPNFALDDALDDALYCKSRALLETDYLASYLQEPNGRGASQHHIAYQNLALQANFKPFGLAHIVSIAFRCLFFFFFFLECCLVQFMAHTP